MMIYIGSERDFRKFTALYNAAQFLIELGDDDLISTENSLFLATRLTEKLKEIESDLDDINKDLKLADEGPEHDNKMKEL